MLLASGAVNHLKPLPTKWWSKYRPRIGKSTIPIRVFFILYYTRLEWWILDVTRLGYKIFPLYATCMIFLTLSPFRCRRSLLLLLYFFNVLIRRLAKLNVAVQSLMKMRVLFVYQHFVKVNNAKNDNAYSRSSPYSILYIYYLIQKIRPYLVIIFCGN